MLSASTENSDNCQRVSDLHLSESSRNSQNFPCDQLATSSAPIRYEIKRTLVEKAFSHVDLVEDSHFGSLCTVKAVSLPNKSALKGIVQQRLQESDKWLMINHPNIQRLKAAWVQKFQSDLGDVLHLVTDYHIRGNLLSIVKQFHPMVVLGQDFPQTRGRMHEVWNSIPSTVQRPEKVIHCLENEVECVRSVLELRVKLMHAYLLYFSEMILAIEYLHSIGIIHRSIKPENFLVTNDLHLKLTDFGPASGPSITSIWSLCKQFVYEESFMPFHANKWNHPTMMWQLNKDIDADRKYAGQSISFVAPELRNSRSSSNRSRESLQAGDWYSLGVTMYKLATGLHPVCDNSRIKSQFADMSQAQIEWNAIKNPPQGNYLLYSDRSPNFVLSANILRLIRLLIQPRPEYRPHISRIKSHTLFDNWDFALVSKMAPKWNWNQFRDSGDDSDFKFCSPLDWTDEHEAQSSMRQNDDRKLSDVDGVKMTADVQESEHMEDISEPINNRKATLRKRKVSEELQTSTNKVTCPKKGRASVNKKKKQSMGGGRRQMNTSSVVDQNSLLHPSPVSKAQREVETQTSKDFPVVENYNDVYLNPRIQNYYDLSRFLGEDEGSEEMEADYGPIADWIDDNQEYLTTEEDALVINEKVMEANIEIENKNELMTQTHDTMGNSNKNDDSHCTGDGRTIDGKPETDDKPSGSSLRSKQWSLFKWIH